MALVYVYMALVYGQKTLCLVWLTRNCYLYKIFISKRGELRRLATTKKIAKKLRVSI
ncbi:MAG: hypothetical protein JWN60_812 [Acidobacteria bacterium]|jgi:hypothetical protein|nr:hypothetical protein [Acidobacteriota bacterium]